MDVSIGSLKHARNIYKDVVHASVTQLPFPSSYFDAVVSEDVLGHIPFDEKQKAYSEMYRVLKRGGLMVHAAIETDSNSFWFQFAKKYPDLFKRHHIDKHGHIGLELPSIIIDRCQKLGFNVKKVDKMHALILYPALLIGWFDNEYRNKSVIVSVLVSISKVIQKSKKVSLLGNLILGIIEKIVNPLLLTIWIRQRVSYCIVRNEKASQNINCNPFPKSRPVHLTNDKRFDLEINNTSLVFKRIEMNASVAKM